MQRLEVSGVVRLIYKSLGVKGLNLQVTLEERHYIFKEQDVSSFSQWSQKSILTILCLLTCLYLIIYTGYPRRNVPNFGRVFLRLKYTDITQNTYIQS